LQLVISCTVTDETRQRWLAHAESQGLELSEVVITGTVSDHELRDLYSMCNLFVEPSLYEGFGYPPAEAAACGAVVITSNTSSLPEVLKDPDSTFDPTNRKQFTQKMHDALEDVTFRSVNRARSKDALLEHTWKSACDRAVEAFARVARIVEIPRRALGELGPVGMPHDPNLHTKISQYAVERFYSTTQFDLDDERTNV
jgi:glycosyltransferase involved in cell wall biosynthesis